MSFRTCLTTAFLALTLVHCHRTREAEHLGPFPGAPVIVISIDTLRADHLPSYGYKGVATPSIDRLATDGVLFEHVYSQCPLTLPSHVAALTGLLPTTNGVRNNLGFRYDAAKFVSLPQVLRQQGYATGGAVSSFVLRGDTGLREAFEWYDDNVEERPGVTQSEFQRSGYATAASASKWLGSLGSHSRSFFLLLHLYEPHAPYSPPEPFRSRFSNPYDGEIATADDIVGGFLATLERFNLYDRSIIVLMSDHGEGLGDHGEQQHGALLYNEEIHVPFIVKLPGNARAGSRVSSNGALVDLPATIESLLGLRPRKTDGVDMFGPLTPERPIYSETIYPYLQLGWSDLRSLVSARLHYIHSPSRSEMYDLIKDPAERSDVIQEHRREAVRMRQLIAEFPPPTTGSTTIDPETSAKLAALGYVGSVRAAADDASRPNPRDVIGTIDETREAFRLVDEGNLQEGMSRLRALVARNPRLVDVWIRLAEVNLDAGRPEEAIQDYRQAIAAAGPFGGDILIDLAHVLLQVGRLDDAEKTARLAMGSNPRKASALLVRIKGTRGDLAGAEALARELASGSSSTPADLELLAEVKVARGDLSGALNLLNDAEHRGGTHGQAMPFGLQALRGEILARTGRRNEAIDAYEKEIAAFPRNMSAYSMLAIVYVEAGRQNDAERTLERLVRANPSSASYELAAQTMQRVGQTAAAREWRRRGTQ